MHVVTLHTCIPFCCCSAAQMDVFLQIQICNPPICCCMYAGCLVLLGPLLRLVLLGPLLRSTEASPWCRNGLHSCYRLCVLAFCFGTAPAVLLVRCLVPGPPECAHIRPHPPACTLADVANAAVVLCAVLLGSVCSFPPFVPGDRQRGGGHNPSVTHTLLDTVLLTGLRWCVCVCACLVCACARVCVFGLVCVCVCRISAKTLSHKKVCAGLTYIC
jgi:hypothetical protein